MGILPMSITGVSPVEQRSMGVSPTKENNVKGQGLRSRRHAMTRQDMGKMPMLREMEAI